VKITIRETADLILLELMGELMRRPPADISIGDYLDQEEIEEAFDRGNVGR
jgi:hypothetical protein